MMERLQTTENTLAQLASNMNEYLSRHTQSTQNDNLAVRVNRNSNNAPTMMTPNTSMNTAPMPNLSMNTSINNAPTPQIEMTYAQALHDSPLRPETIRNISIMGNEDEVAATLKVIECDKFITELKLCAIIRKSNNNYTVKCPSVEIANQFEQHIRVKFNENKVICSAVQIKIPQIKIMGAKLDISDDEESDQLKASVQIQLLQQNEWLEKFKELKVDDVYKVNNSRNSYVNVIISLDLKSQKAILDRGKVLLGFSQCRVREHINLIQCSNCHRYGNFRRT